MNLDLIIPAYNAKKTINRTLYSIALQENIKGLKVYIVNDCSKYDYSEEIEFFSKYLDISEIKLDKNSGPGIARNIGMEQSNSKYIMFMDSDDYLYNPYSITNLYNSIIDKNFDVILSDFFTERFGNRYLSGGGVELTWLHGKMYKRSFLKKNNIYFSDIVPDEDNFFNRLVALSSPKIGYLERVTYVYYDNKSSITRKNHDKSTFYGMEGFTINLYSALSKFIDKKDCLPVIAITANNSLIVMYFCYLEFYEKFNEEIDKILIWSKKIKEIYDELKDEYLKDYMIKNMLITEEKEYKRINVEITKIITFEEFLQKVDEA